MVRFTAAQASANANAARLPDFNKLAEEIVSEIEVISKMGLRHYGKNVSAEYSEHDMASAVEALIAAGFTVSNAKSYERTLLINWP